MQHEIFSAQFYHKFPISPGKFCYWQNLLGSSQGLAIAEAAKNYCQPILVITQDLNAAKLLEQELRFFTKDSPEIPILSFPDWETLPYDQFSPHQDIISERLFTLYQFLL